jgi:hypothetical protein
MPLSTIPAMNSIGSLEDTFSWVQTIADSVRILVSPVHLHLVEKIESKNDFLGWVPHDLTDELWPKRVELTRPLLELLENQ